MISVKNSHLHCFDQFLKTEFAEKLTSFASSPKKREKAFVIIHYLTEAVLKNGRVGMGGKKSNLDLTAGAASGFSIGDITALVS